MSRTDLGLLAVNDFIDRNALTPQAASPELLEFMTTYRTVGFVQFHKKDFQEALNADIALNQLNNPTPFTFNPEQTPELQELGLFANTPEELAQHYAEIAAYEDAQPNRPRRI